MIRKTIRILKKIIICFLLIYGYNLIISPIDMIIPLNIVTISYVTILGIPAFLSLIVISFIIY